jgi:hypothetical protein
MLGVAYIDIKILRLPPLGRGMPFLDNDTCAEWRGGGYLFLPGFSSLYDVIHGWMESLMKNDHDVLYYM